MRLLLSVPGRILGVVVLAGVFLVDLVLASVAVARIVLARRPDTTPAIVVVPTALRSAWGVVVFANFLSLTPGSTCLHVSGDRRRLYVHLLHTDNPDREPERLKRLYERWILMAEGTPRDAEEEAWEPAAGARRDPAGRTVRAAPGLTGRDLPGGRAGRGGPGDAGRAARGEGAG